MKTVKALDVRKRFGSLLDEVVKKHQPVIVERSGRPLVVMVSFEQYQAEHDLTARQERLRAVSTVLERWRQRNAKALARVDAVQAIRELRASR